MPNFSLAGAAGAAFGCYLSMLVRRGLFILVQSLKVHGRMTDTFFPRATSLNRDRKVSGYAGKSLVLKSSNPRGAVLLK